MLSFITLTRIRMVHGVYSPEYCECFARKKGSDLMTAYPFKQAIDDDFTSHFMVADKANHENSIQYPSSLILNRIDFNQNFESLLKEYGKPELFNAAYEKNIPFMVAGYKGKSGKIQYKNLMFFVDKTFVMSEFQIYGGADDQQLSLAKEILTSKSIHADLSSNDHLFLTDNQNNCLLLMKLAFGISIISFNKNNELLIKTCLKLQPDKFDDNDVYEDENPSQMM